MKIRRQKQAKHLLGAYRNFFGIHEPYSVIIDGTFCRISSQYNVQIKEELARYLGGDVSCLTTRCVLAELDMLGSAMYDAKLIAQRFKIFSCSHRKKPISAQDCLKNILKDGNSYKLLLATQDFDITKLARSIPGIPILYLHKNKIVLDKMSKPSLKLVEEISQGKANPAPEQEKMIRAMKLEASISSSKVISRKRKGPKGRNPLSCKPSKKLKATVIEPQAQFKRRRKRKSGVSKSEVKKSKSV